MNLLVVYRTCVYDERRQEYVSCYFLDSMPRDAGLASMLSRRKLPVPSTLNYAPETCRYYFVKSDSRELYVAAEFGRLVSDIVARGYSLDTRVLRDIKAENNTACLVIRRKLSECV